LYFAGVSYENCKGSVLTTPLGCLNQIEPFTE